MMLRLLFIPVFCLSIAAYAQHTGRVFIDRNGNGCWDKGESPGKEVCVSDGLHVVKTDADGRFMLPGHSRQRFVFITVPSGYKCSRYYAPVKEKGEYEFALQPYDGVRKDGRHDFIHISDTEIFNTAGHEDWVGNLKDYAAVHAPAFIVHTGDICYENGLKNHTGLLNTANTPCPVYYCIGNHDLVKGKYGEELFEQIYGPVYYSFDAGNVHYIVTPMAGGDYQPGYTREDVYRWMKNDLACVKRGKTIMVFNHDLLTAGDKFVFGISPEEQIDLNAHGLKAWIFGHWHINYMKKQGEVYAVSTATLDKGGIDHSTSAFRVMHVNPLGDFTSELRYTYIDKSMRIVTPVEQQVPVGISGEIPVSVNVYHAVAAARRVKARILADGQEVAVMDLQPLTDWNWYAVVKPRQDWLHRQLFVEVEAEFENGEKAVRRNYFRYPAEKEAAIRFSSDWPTLGGGASHRGQGDSACRPPLRLCWLKNIGANLYMSSPVISDGRIFVASVDENLKGDAALYALEGKNGEIVWKYRVRNSVKNTIAVEDGCVLAQDAEGWLYAVDSRTGKLRWERKLEVNGLPALIEGLTADKGIVYAGTGKGLVACRVDNGEVIWQNQAWKQGEGTTTTVAVGQGVVVSGVQWGALYGNAADDGRLLWSASADGLRNRGASAAVYDGLLYIISDKSLFVLKTETGEVIVRKQLPHNIDVTSTPLLTDRLIVFGSAASGLLALDRETLEQKWQYLTKDALIYTVPYTRRPSATVETSPVLAGGTIWFGASDGNFYGIDPATGREVWKFETGAPVFNSVAVSGNTLVGADFAGNVYLFSSCK